jgi:hypothetical protein
LGKIKDKHYIHGGEIVRYFAIEENVNHKKLLENQREELVVSLVKRIRTRRLCSNSIT